MSHTLEQTRNKNPMWFYERNYMFLMSVFSEFFISGHLKSIFKNELITLSVERLENSRYTSLICLKVVFKKLPQIDSISMTIRIYHDAGLAEVIAYQNISRLVAPCLLQKINKEGDHKRQANLLLYEILSTCEKTILTIT